MGITHLKRESRPIGSDSYTSASGKVSAQTVVYRESRSPSYKSMTGYYHDVAFGDASSGTEYKTDYAAMVIRDGDNIVGETVPGSIFETYTIEGTETVPTATGVYMRGVGIAFTALDKTVYYLVEEISFPVVGP